LRMEFCNSLAVEHYAFTADFPLGFAHLNA